MTFARTACWVCVAALALLAGGSAVAQAGTRNEDILVLSRDGTVRAHTATGATAAEVRPPRGAARTTATAKKKPKRTVLRELARLRDRAAITPEDYTARRASYTRAKQTARKLTGTRKRELTAVIATLDGIAQRGKLTATRVAPLFLTLDRNVEWWTTGPIPASGQRVGFAGSELVCQYFAVQGMQIQWLGTFGKLYALAKGSKCNNT